MGWTGDLALGCESLESEANTLLSPGTHANRRCAGALGCFKVLTGIEVIGPVQLEGAHCSLLTARGQLRYPDLTLYNLPSFTTQHSIGKVHGSSWKSLYGVLETLKLSILLHFHHAQFYGPVPELDSFTCPFFSTFTIHTSR